MIEFSDELIKITIVLFDSGVFLWNTINSVITNLLDSVCTIDGMKFQNFK